MKLVRENINEKFEENSDPIRDLDIGMTRLVKEWMINLLQKYKIYPDSLFDMGYQYSKMFSINDDLTIDVHQKFDISWQELENIPEYIKFNIIDGDFACCFTKECMLRSSPKEVRGYYKVYRPSDEDIIDANFIRSVCKVDGIIGIYDL